MQATVPVRHRLRGLAMVSAVALLTGPLSLAACSSGEDPASSTGSTPTAVSKPGSIEGQVLFTRTGDEDRQTLYIASGTHERRVSAPGDYCCVFRISPDRNRILVLPGGDVPPPLTGATIHLDGTGFRRLPVTDRHLNLVPTAWSPDAARFAYLGWDDSDPGRRGMYTSTVDGRDLVRVTVRPGQLDDEPLDYSPDGRRLVFYRSAHPDPDPHTDGSLWVVDVDGSGLHRITTSASPPADAARWSPDGKRIVFADERTAAKGAVWTVAPDGSHLTKVFSDPKGRFPLGPLWSPDGTHILVALDPTSDAFKHPDNGLYTITAAGTQLRLVVGTKDFKAPSDWWQ